MALNKQEKNNKYFVKKLFKLCLFFEVKKLTGTTKLLVTTWKKVPEDLFSTTVVTHARRYTYLLIQTLLVLSQKTHSSPYL